MPTIYARRETFDISAARPLDLSPSEVEYRKSLPKLNLCGRSPHVGSMAQFGDRIVSKLTDIMLWRKSHESVQKASVSTGETSSQFPGEDAAISDYAGIEISNHANLEASLLKEPSGREEIQDPDGQITIIFSCCATSGSKH